MAMMVSSLAGEGGGQVASFRTIEELLQTCASGASVDTLYAAGMNMNSKAPPLVSEGDAKGLDSSIGDGEACNAGSSQEAARSFFERQQVPCAVGVPVLPLVSGAGRERMADAVVDGQAERSEAAESSFRGADDGIKHDMLRAQQAASALLDIQSWETRRSVGDSLADLIRDDASTRGVADDSFKLSPPPMDPVSVAGRGATTTTCSVASNNDESRHEDMGRVPQGALDNVNSTAFPFVATTSINSVSGSVETDGDSQAAEQDGEQSTKLAGAPATFKSSGQPRVQMESGGMQTDAQAGGIWSLGTTVPSNSSSVEQLLQRVMNATKPEVAPSPSVGAPVWGGEGRAFWDQSHLLADAARFGGRTDFRGTLENQGLDRSGAFNQLLALCNPSVSATLPAWQVLQGGNAAPAAVGGAACEPRMSGCNLVLPGDGTPHFAAPGSESNVFGQHAASPDSLPHLNSVTDSSGLRGRLPSSSHLALLLQADLLRSQELLNYCGGVGGLRATDMEDLLAKVRQLQGMTSVNNFLLPGAHQAPFFGNVPQTPGFSIFGPPNMAAANEAAGLLLPKPDTFVGTALGLAKSDAAAKKVRKDGVFAEAGQKKRPRKPKSKDTSRTESPCPGSPKMAPRKKRVSSQSSVKTTDSADSEAPSSLANDLRVMTELANMTEEDIAELEAEAFRRQSNRSRNCPPEVITAVDFDGSIIRFSKVIGLHYHPKQNRWLAWRSQKGSKKVFKSFSTKKFGISGARLMALRWRLGHGVVAEEGQDGLSDMNDIDDQAQSLSGDERCQLPLDAAGPCDEMSDATATGGQGRSESSTPSNAQEMIAAAAPTQDKSKVGVLEKSKAETEVSTSWDAVQEEALSPVASAASSDSRPADIESKLNAPISSLISDRLGLLLGSITPADDLTDSDRSRLAALSLDGGEEVCPPPLADNKELCAG